MGPMTQTTATPFRTARKPAPESNVKETVEQILIAFILAFMFRCFIVEAFVIPTGSMAPTLLGAHMDFRCPDCGWKWKVNYSGDSDGDDVRVPPQAEEVYPIRCPNCGFKLPRTQPGDESNDASFPNVQYGDRILVQKYIYLLHDPARWDVVVFKSPDIGSLSRYGVEQYTQNYIKRCTGLPGETLMVLDGDIYVSTADKPLSQLTPNDFTVQTKPYKAQEALWRVVYDNDYQPRGQQRTYQRAFSVADPSQPNGQRLELRTELEEKPWQQPWVQADGSKGWDVSSRTFRFDNTAAAGKLDFDVTAMPDKHSMTDWLAYDVSHNVGRKADNFLDPGYSSGRGDPINNVSDVKLAVSYRRTAGDGPLRLNLTKQDHKFTAVVSADGLKLFVTRPNSSTPELLGESKTSFGDAFRRIEFANADYRVSVRLDGSEVIATTPQQFHPDVKQLLADFDVKRPQAAATVSIEAERQQCELAHVSLWRDVYYLNKDWPRQDYIWAMPDNFPNGTADGHLVRLKKDEFFTMGDNSMLSSDARCWTSPVNLAYENVVAESGRVPRRFMLGKAFFVYWPAGYAPVASLPGFVPNFGEMRFIH